VRRDGPRRRGDGSRGIDAGRLRLAGQLEPLTAVLISINKKHNVHSGVALTGLVR
jgi:predicted dinucleotide-binding enzyme